MISSPPYIYEKLFKKYPRSFIFEMGVSAKSTRFSTQCDRMNWNLVFLILESVLGAHCFVSAYDVPLVFATVYKKDLVKKHALFRVLTVPLFEQKEIKRDGEKETPK